MARKGNPISVIIIRLTLLCFWFVVLYILSMEFHVIEVLMERVSLALGRKALIVALSELGLSGHIVLALDLAVRGLLIAGVTQYMVLHNEEGTSGTKHPRPSSSSSPGSSPSIPEQGQPPVEQREVSVGGSLSSIEGLPDLGDEEVEQGIQVRDEAGPSHQVRDGDGAGPSKKPVPNLSFEDSVRKRIASLEKKESPYLLDKEKGEYWGEIKKELKNATSQKEYSETLDFENRDLQIREEKDRCLRQFKDVLSQHPSLAENAPYDPSEVFDDFMDKNRDALDKLTEKPLGDRDRGEGISVPERDRREIAFLEQLSSDLQNDGPTTVKEILSETDEP